MGAGTSLLIINDFPCSYKYSFCAFLCNSRYEKRYIWLNITRRKLVIHPLIEILSITKPSGIALVEIKEMYVTRFMSNLRVIFVSYASRFFCFSRRHTRKMRNWSSAKANFGSPSSSFSVHFAFLTRLTIVSCVMPRESKSQCLERYADLCISMGEGWKKYYKASKYIFFRGRYIAPRGGITELKLTMRRLRELHTKEKEGRGARRLDRRRSTV